MVSSTPEKKPLVYQSRDKTYVLVFAQKRQVQQDRQRRRVGGQDDELADTAVQGLGRLVGALLRLAVVGRLLDQVEEFLLERLVGWNRMLASWALSWTCAAPLRAHADVDAMVTYRSARRRTRFVRFRTC